MDPAPTANPNAELVTECFGECPGFESPLARTWSPITPPDKRSWWGVVIEPPTTAVSKEEEGDHFRDDKVVDVGCGVDDMPRSSWGRLPGLAGHGGGEVIGQGRQHTCAVEDMSGSEGHGRRSLPSLKDLGLDMLIGKRN